MSSRTTRRALSSRQVNVDNNNINNGKSSSSSSILPSKKDSRLLLQRSGSTASSNASSTTSSATNVNDKGFSSLSSDTLRRAISTGSSSNTADTADHGAGLAMKSTKSKQQPLGISTKQNRTNIPSTKSTSTSKPSSSNSEPITIVEHRKRPSGDGYTVHKYLKGKLLGKGGFAKVYKVTSLDTNKEYAVKIVPKANLVKSRARQKVCCFVVCCMFVCLLVCLLVGNLTHPPPSLNSTKHQTVTN